LRDAAGAVVATVSRSFPPTYHEQQSAAAFLGVSSLPEGGSVTIAGRPDLAGRPTRSTAVKEV
jgi:hypothetical protein